MEIDWGPGMADVRVGGSGKGGGGNRGEGMEYEELLARRQNAYESQNSKLENLKKNRVRNGATPVASAASQVCVWVCVCVCVCVLVLCFVCVRALVYVCMYVNI